MFNKPKIPKPVVLVILDGWGVAPAFPGNAISQAKTPFFDRLISEYPVFTLQASGEAVGLPWGEMGNSEVGHLNLGAGKVIFQSLLRINRAIQDASFFTNPALLAAVKQVKEKKSNLHLLGLLSTGGVHSTIEHLFALLELAKKEKVSQVYIHTILDGRDVPRDSAIDFIKQLQDKIKKIGVGKIATISGRFYAMDRDNHWERIEKVYRAMTEGRAETVSTDPVKAVETSYLKKVYDEEFVPVVITESGSWRTPHLHASERPVAKVEDEDAVIFYNFRSDRARELTKAFVLKDFDKFERPKKLDIIFVTMTEYEEGLPVEMVFPKEKIEMPLARVISEARLKQFHIAETQKYAHVTYFFNGGKEKLFKGQINKLIPSPRVSSFAEKPEMSAPAVAKETISAVKESRFDFILVNFANPDMVGHTGNLKAAIQAVEIVDNLLKLLVESILAKGGAALIVADHGNAEQMINLQTKQVDKEHTINPVPFIIVGSSFKLAQSKKQVPDLSLIQPVGVLADVTPTVLKVIGLKQPEEMTGKSLV